MTLMITAEVAPLVMNDSGAILVGGTRVSIDSILVEFKQGTTPEEIIGQFDSLKLADVYAAIAFYLRHQAEVEAYLCEREKIAEALHEQIEQKFPSKGLRDRLLARHEAKNVSSL
jgi:uncharacterized protein (DUF433 family)